MLRTAASFVRHRVFEFPEKGLEAPRTLALSSKKGHASGLARAIDSSPNTRYVILVTNITRRAEASCFSPFPEKEAERRR